MYLGEEQGYILAVLQVNKPYQTSREKLYLTMAGIQTCHLRFTSVMLYQLSYKAKPEATCRVMVFVFDVSKLTSLLQISCTDYIS